MTAPMSSDVVTRSTSIAPPRRLDALGDEDDRERVRDRPEEERDVPAEVAPGEVASSARRRRSSPIELGSQRRVPWLSCEHLPSPRRRSSDLLLERAAGGREERLLERVRRRSGASARRPARARAARRGRGSRPARRAPRPRSGRACRAGSSSRASRAISRMKSCTSSFERGSSPVVGSSSRSSTGEVSSARASATFCCMPRERFSIGSLRRSGGKPTRPRISGSVRGSRDGVMP